MTNRRFLFGPWSGEVLLDFPFGFQPSQTTATENRPDTNLGRLGSLQGRTRMALALIKDVIRKHGAGESSR